MSWRYQPVWKDYEDGPVYSLCEVYFEDDGTLRAWTEEPAMTPQGNDLRDLQGDLAHMLCDAWKWQPVKFDELKVGMTFERAVTQEQGEHIATLIEISARSAAEDQKSEGVNS